MNRSPSSAETRSFHPFKPVLGFAGLQVILNKGRKLRKIVDPIAICGEARIFGQFLRADHVEEAGMDTPAIPMIFNKQSTCVIGPGEAIQVPRVSDVVDYEGELGVVIGTRCRHVTAAEALERLRARVDRRVGNAARSTSSWAGWRLLRTARRKRHADIGRTARPERRCGIQESDPHVL